jgi:hypothetical protein
MAQRRRAPMNVHTIERDPEVAADANDDGSECLVDLEQIHVLGPPADLLE